MIEPELDVHDIQGHSLRGFDTPFVTLLGIKIEDPGAARPWLAAISHRLDTLDGVHRYRVVRSFHAIRAPRVLLNLAISAHGLSRIGIDLTPVEDGLFLSPMGLNAASLGDAVDDSMTPTEYVVGGTWDTTPDILLMIGGDTSEVTAQFTKSLQSAISMAGCSLTYEEYGNLLPGETEHFGFRDGISQVGPRGRLSNVADDYLTLRFLSHDDPNAPFFARPGQPLVWPGQFVFGYPTQLPATPLEPGPLSDGGAPWMRNGSFLVFRRLRQDVAEFNKFVGEQAVSLSAMMGKLLSAEEVGAMVVGRWKDGSPVLLTRKPDPVVSGDMMFINDFAYGQGTPVMTVITDGKSRTLPAQPGDYLAQLCPHFAHIRKVNPRDLTTDQGISGRTLTFQMLRRGIPYGPPYATGAENADRGLLFLAYQTSFKRQFQVLNSLWMNNPSAPELTGEGHDLLVGQNPVAADRLGTLRDPLGSVTATLRTGVKWVVPTGGGFFFAPSLSLLQSFK